MYESVYPLMKLTQEKILTFAAKIQLYQKEKESHLTKNVGSKQDAQKSITIDKIHTVDDSAAETETSVAIKKLKTRGW